MATPKLTGVTVYLPNGEVKRISPDEIFAYGTSPTIIVATKKGEKLTRYCGFPTVFHEEISEIELIGDTRGIVAA